MTENTIEQDEEKKGTEDGAGPSPEEGQGLSLNPTQQKALDAVIAARLKREREKWQEEAARRVKEAEEASETKRLEDEQKWEALAHRNQQKATEAATRLEEVETRYRNAEQVLTRILDAKLRDLPSAVTDLLKGRDIVDQLAIVEAFVASQPAPPETEGSPRPTGTTPPSPRPQGARSLTAEERRARARTTF